jgi:hypothetical protein
VRQARHERCPVGTSIASGAGMEQSTVILEQDAAGHLALLTLRRGVSAWGTWAFDAKDAGTTITIGSASGCDWQIASPGVTSLSLVFTGDALLARCARPDVRVRLNGAPLWPGWVSLGHGDRLELGPSCVEVNLAEGLRPKAQKPRFERKQRGARRRTSRGGSPPRGSADGHGEQVGAAVLVRRDSFSDAVPALFQERRSRISIESVCWYLAIAVATLLAYAGWLALLEHI